MEEINEKFHMKLLGFRQDQWKKWVDQRTPFSVLFELTPKCNLNCIHYQINEIGFFIWNNIDGKNSSNDLADLIKSAINDEVDYQTILSDVSEFLSELNNNGFIKKTPVSAL